MKEVLNLIGYLIDMPKGIKGFQKGNKIWLGRKRPNRLEEWRKNLSKSHKGHIPWNKGKKVTSNTGRTWFKKGNVGYWIGKKRPKKTTEKISASLLGRTRENSRNWKGGISGMKEYKNIYRLRYIARKKNAIGFYTFGEWQTLKAQYNWTCPACKRSEPNINLGPDHIIPLSKGGSNNIENIQPLCRNCNCKKYTKIIKYEN